MLHLTLRQPSLTGMTAALALMAAALAVQITLVQRAAGALASRPAPTAAERAADRMARRMQDELRGVQAAIPSARMSSGLGAAGFDSIRCDALEGFPSAGSLVLQPGTEAEERVTYGAIDAREARFLEIERGEKCSIAGPHAAGHEVRWEPAALVLAAVDPAQGDPAGGNSAEDGAGRKGPGPSDGTALAAGAELRFRGHGTGFAWRVPDPAGAQRDTWSALTFEPRATVSEAARDRDLNGDGDREDIFELGHIRLRSWSAGAPETTTTDENLCSAMVLQERCGDARDLDGDGYDDPIFLWDPETQRLHLRLFLLVGDAAPHHPVRGFERTIDLGGTNPKRGL